jgi:hypothetical protein
MITYQFRAAMTDLRNRGVITIRVPRDNEACLDCLVANATGRESGADVRDIPALFWNRCATPGCKCLLGLVRGNPFGMVLILREHGLRVEVNKDNPRHIEIRGACR